MDLTRLLMTLLRVLAGLAGMYVLYAAILFALQRQLIYPGQYLNAPRHPQVDVQNIEQLWIETPNARSEVWLRYPPSTDGDSVPLLIVAHGNAELIDDLPLQLRPFNQMGLALALVEYPGYGRSEGNPTQQSIGEIFRRTYDRLAARDDIDSTRIFGYGRSVGGGIICQLAADRDLAALILQSTFTRTSAFAREFYLPGFLVRDTYDNEKVLRSYPHPVLLIHGRRDRQVPFEHGRQLARTAANAELVAYDCGHNDCPPRWDRFWRDVSSFLRTHNFFQVES